ncbi:FAD-dependent monooxygenase [Amycolatopsis sp. NPDC059021]|uniref:FAD-dependent monooxygenase n=1 Tax=Amycolatopsis sp. NPDC059021 TaxID=3346704 RepID=UPI00366FAC55
MNTVVIAGAGPTGLTLACELARRGTPVRVLEKSPEFPRSSRAKGPNQRSLEIFEDLGVLKRIFAAGSSAPVMRKYRDGKLISATDPWAGATPTPDRPYERGWLIAQYRVEEILREKLAEYGAHVELGAELTSFTQDETGVRGTLADGTRFEAAYLIGCDGGHSTVRKLLGIPLVGETAEEQRMVLGDVEVTGIDRGFWHQWLDTDGGVLLCPVPGTERTWWFQAAPERGPDGAPLGPSLESFRRLFARHARLPGEWLIKAELLSTYRVNVRMAERYRAGRVLLAGDAAHVHPIAGGMGMNTGIQDAYNLGWKLALVAAGEAGDALLDSYEAERLPIAAWTLEVTSERLRMALAEIRKPGGGLDVVVTEETSTLGVGYRWSPLSLRPSTSDSPLQPGDRAPDAPCADVETGAVVRLFETFAGPHFTLLGFGERAAAALPGLATPHGNLVRPVAIDAGAPGLSDKDGHAARAYGITGDTLVLIRPDNYVAAIVATNEAPRIADHLTALRT